ncbi:hypothetical protein EGW35_01710 [Enterococcus durans]|uniref:hypothetical protein n=1 Tax=Enterococcus durans TaxID=53345 RepID=UPI000F4D3D5F|nr:hypothetical protein [Enterococcus durans]ROX85301.1 hypothetical protein EGW35_01710 [Enterococcus durans]
MNISPEKDPEIRQLENGMEKMPKQSMGILRKFFASLVDLGKKIKGFILRRTGKVDLTKATTNKSSIKKGSPGISRDSISLKKEKFQSKAHSQKQSLKAVVSKAVEKANKANQNLDRTVSLDRTRS